MLRDKIVELSRELADLRSQNKSCSETFGPSPLESTHSCSPGYSIKATSDPSFLQSDSGGQPDCSPCCAGDGSAELGIHLEVSPDKPFPRQHFGLHKPSD